MERDRTYNFNDAYGRICEAANTRTQEEVAKVLDLTASSISDAKLKNSIPDSWLLKLYKKFRLEPDWVLYGIGPRSLQNIPFSEEHVVEDIDLKCKATVYSMTPSNSGQGFWKRQPIGKLTLPEAYATGSVMVAQIDNQSMAPAIKQNAYVGINASDLKIKSGEIYALDMKGEGLVVKRILHDHANKQFILASDNPSYQPQRISIESQDYAVIGKIIWVIQEL